MSIVDILNEANASTILDVDLLGGGTNIVLVPGEWMTYEIDERQFGYRAGELTIVRAQLRKPTEAAQHPTMICQIASTGEIQGIFIEAEQVEAMSADQQSALVRFEDGRILAPFPAYWRPGFAGWRGWTHFIATEFQNPDADAVTRFEKLMLAQKWVDYVLPENATVEYTRIAESLWEKRPPTKTANGRLAEQIANGLKLSSLTLVADERKAPMLTEYLKADDTPEERAGFTSFADAHILAFNGYTTTMEPLVAEYELDKSDTELRSQLRKVARAESGKLAVLSGQLPDDEGGWPLRPTFGRCSIAIPVKGKEPQVFDLDFFGDRRAVVAESAPAEPAPAPSVEDEPFEIGEQEELPAL